MNIGIAWPHTMPFYHKFFTERMFCLSRPRGEFRLLIPNSDGPLDSIRNELCQQALISGGTHIFCLLSHELPIVCAKVHRRKAPYDPLLKLLNPNREDKDNPYVDVPYNKWALRSDPNELIEVDATGTGD